MVFQPLLAAGYLSGIGATRARKIHGGIGVALVALILFHVGALWVTSPPDIIDALLFSSPTPFSAWGVIAMWALFATALLAWRRRRLGPVLWRVGHTALAVTIVTGSVLHALLIEGAMGRVSKSLLCLVIVAVTAKTIVDRRAWAALFKRN